MNPVCPQCSITTELIRWKDIEGFECPSCRGHVIRGKQLEQFLEKHGTQRFSNFTALARAAPASTRALICPGCATQSYRALRCGVVEVDVCATCSSVYFDAGEATLYMRQSLVRKFGANALEVTEDTASGVEGLYDLITNLLD